MVRPSPALPAIEAGKGRQRQGAHYVSDPPNLNHCRRHRYRQELIPHRRPGRSRRDCAVPEVVAWPGRGTLCQYDFRDAEAIAEAGSVRR